MDGLDEWMDGMGGSVFFWAWKRKWAWKPIFDVFLHFFTCTFTFSRPLFLVFFTFFTPNWSFFTGKNGIFWFFFTGTKSIFTGILWRIFTCILRFSRVFLLIFFTPTFTCTFGDYFHGHKIIFTCTFGANFRFFHGHFAFFHVQKAENLKNFHGCLFFHAQKIKHWYTLIKGERT